MQEYTFTVYVVYICSMQLGPPFAEVTGVPQMWPSIQNFLSI